MQPATSLPILWESPGKFNPPRAGVQPAGRSTGDDRAWAPATALDARGLYLHVPFCAHKCHYCDFYSIVETRGGDEDRQGAFVQALLGELAARVAAAPRRPRTIFVGGGTPTLVRPELWQWLLRGMAELGVLDAVEEFTVEANPETVTPKLMGVLGAGGVNRVSMGAQSFDPGLLKVLERRHDPASVPRAIRIARAAGIERINLDLIFAIPGQSLDAFDRDLDAALATGVTHLSCYGLTYEPHTAMTVRLDQGKITPADEDHERALYEHAITRLGDAGFEHYEVSAWARPGQRCRHNLLYWTNGTWLGVGPSAASHLADMRWRNAPHLGRYLAGAPMPPTVDHEQLDADARLGESLMLRLRLREGIPTDWLDAHVPEASPRRREIDRLVDAGLLEWAPAPISHPPSAISHHLRLTHAGLMVADAVIAQLL